jgi:class 3 adenylate cyclase
LRSCFARFGGEEIKHEGDGFFVAFSSPAPAIECALAIQRRLASHRQSAGFAPAIRVGVHTAEANRAGLDYTGRGVNEAARIAGAAAGGEILASAATFGTARGRFAEVNRRSVELKGIAAPVELVSIDWH